MDDAQAIRTIGWRQGSIIAFEDLPAECLFEPSFAECPSESIFIIITQDCDLVQDDFEKEPFVEVIRSVKVTKQPDGNLLYGKNPRTLHFFIGEQLYEASCHDRARTQRNHLANCQPSQWHSLDKKTIHIIREWISKRYIRPAFPDTFNARIKKNPQGKAIKTLIESKGHLFQEIYISCNPSDSELDADTPYTIAIWLTMSCADYEITNLRIDAVEAGVALENAIQKCQGINLSSCEVRHEGQITLDDLCFFAPWDFNYITHRESLIS